MELPKLQSYIVRLLDAPQDWTLSQVDGNDAIVLINAMEDWGRTNLEPRQAAMGQFTATAQPSWYRNDPELDPTTAPPMPMMVQFWIVRHDNTDRVYPNYEVMLRILFNGRYHVWRSRHDELVYGLETNFETRRTYDRVREGIFGQWGVASATMPQYPTNSTLMTPAVRTAALFAQCRRLADGLQTFLRLRAATVGSVEDPNWPLGRLLSTSMLFQASTRLPKVIFPTPMDMLDQQVLEPTSFGDHPEIQGRRWLQRTHSRLKKSGGLATPEQLALFEYLRAENEWLNEHRKEVKQYTAVDIKRLNTRWVNRIAQHLGAFLK